MQDFVQIAEPSIHRKELTVGLLRSIVPGCGLGIFFRCRKVLKRSISWASFAKSFDAFTRSAERVFKRAFKSAGTMPAFSCSAGLTLSNATNRASAYRSN